MPTTPLSPPAELDVFKPFEVHFLNGLKRRERNEVLATAKRQRRAVIEEPLRITVLRSRLPEAIKAQIFDQLAMPQHDKYVRWVRQMLRVPIARPCASVFSHLSPATGIALASAALDAHATGFQEAKTEVLKLVCQQLCGGKDAPTYALGLEGPAGTGKSHFVRNALSAALHRPVAYVPLGGATDVSYLLGHGYTYEESKPGRLSTALIESGCSNPIFFFDELDKISQTPRGEEITSTLIHLIDPTTNDRVHDRYLQGLDLDFSGCLFVFTYNNPTAVSPILLDRIHRIAVPALTPTDKATIVHQHVLPRVRARLNTRITLSEEAVEEIVRRGGEREGMRQTERDVEAAVASAQLTAVRANVDPNTLAPLSKAFLEASLKPASCASSAPPPGMYM